MNIHVLLTDYSFLLFAGAAAEQAANAASRMQLFDSIDA
jgi:hypothetical protein